MKNKAIKISIYTHWVLVSQPEWNQIEYASVTGPFPLSRRRKENVKQIITAETMLSNNFWPGLNFCVTY